MEKVKKLSKTTTTTTHRHRQQHGGSQRESGLGQVEEGKGGINGDGRRLDLWW